MRRRAIAVTLAGVGLLAVRALAPRLHARLTAGCERMFEQMPDEFPPKRMLRGIEEIRANSARTLALLEAREQAGEDEMVRVAAPSRAEVAPLGTNEEEELAAVGASAPGSDA
jgi:hypothetical protein